MVQMEDQGQTAKMEQMVLLVHQEVTEGQAQVPAVYVGVPWIHPKGKLWTHREAKNDQVILKNRGGHGHHRLLVVAERRFV